MRPLDLSAADPAHDPVPLSEVIECVRRECLIAPATEVKDDTLLEDELGVTGDDGEELLEAASEHFGVSLADGETGWRWAFNLADDEVLFEGEGCLPMPRLPAWLRRLAGLRPRKAIRVRKTTVGDLHRAILRAKGRQRPASHRRGRTPGSVG